MVEQRVQRRLAAILAADVVGFSRMMEADEAGTMTTLKSRRREVLDPLVAKHQGRIFKTTGDSVLVEFGSTVNAVQCAIEFQAAMAAANGDLPEDRRIVVRVGIHLGDVMVEGSDLYGDGVNIEAALDEIADQRLHGHRVFRRALDQPERVLVAVHIDTDCRNQGNVFVQVNAVNLDHQQPETGKIPCHPVL